jgi:hypothetical protein
VAFLKSSYNPLSNVNKMGKMIERTSSSLRGLRVFVQFSKEELQKRRYLLPPATVNKTYQEEGNESDSVFHVLELDGESAFTARSEPLKGKPRHIRTWILALSMRGALERLAERGVQSEQIDVTLFVKHDDCVPCSKTLDPSVDLLEICPGIISLMPTEKRKPANRVAETNLQGRMLTVAVDHNEWQDLSGRVQLNTVLEVQLSTWPKAIPNYWSSRSPGRKIEYLGINLRGSVNERKLVQLKADSNLYYFSGPARRMNSRKYFDSHWQKEREKREVLLDCGIPVVFEEVSNPGEPSHYVQNEGEFLMGLCFLWGSISYSGTLYRTPLVSRVVGITEMDFVPPFVLLDILMMPQSTKPEIRVSYHSEAKESLEGLELGGYVPPS